MRKNGQIFVALILVAVVALAATAVFFRAYLPFGYTEIHLLISSPQNYEGQQVKVKGKVTDTLKVPFLDIKYYAVNDGTGEITVVTNAGLPTQGSDISVIGTVDNAAIIAGQAIGLKLVEMERF